MLFYLGLAALVNGGRAGRQRVGFGLGLEEVLWHQAFPWRSSAFCRRRLFRTLSADLIFPLAAFY